MESVSKKFPQKVIIENCTIYGKLVCSQCGKDTALRKIQLVTNDLKDQWEDILCFKCIKDIPSYDEL
jgi:hypothetical protein